MSRVMKYMMTVTQTAAVPSDRGDRLENPAGSYPQCGTSEEDALTRFHDTVPIGCMDDFEITCEEQYTTISRVPDDEQLKAYDPTGETFRAADGKLYKAMPVQSEVPCGVDCIRCAWYADRDEEPSWSPDTECNIKDALPCGDGEYALVDGVQVILTGDVYWQGVPEEQEPLRAKPLEEGKGDGICLR